MNIIRADQGETLKVLGDEVTIKRSAADSPYAMSIVHVSVPPGSGTPCVTHSREEEVYLVVEGELSMHTPEGKIVLQQGDMAHIPPKTPHGYRNASELPARFIAWAVGGPMDGFFREMAADVHQLPADFSRMQEVMQRYGVERAQS